MPCLNGKIHPSMIGEFPWETGRGVQIYGGNGGMGEQSNIYKERAAAFFSISILPKIVWAMWSCSMSVLVNFKLCFPFFFIATLKQWTDKCDLLSGTRSIVTEVPQAKIICLKAAGAFWFVGHIQKPEHNWIQFKSNVADWRKRLTIARITLYFLQWEHGNCGTPFSLSSQFNNQTITSIGW